MLTSDDGSSSMRVFGAVVRAMREAKGYTQERLGDYAGYSKSQVAMVERGQRMPSRTFTDRAEEFLDARGAVRAAAQHLARDRGHPVWFGEYADREAEAVSVYSYDAHVIKGLIQTESYARAVLSAHYPVLEDEVIERHLEARMARQALLTRTPPASLPLVVEESVLRRPVGGRSALKGQLEHLVRLAEKRNISIQIMPLTYERTRHMPDSTARLLYWRHRGANGSRTWRCRPGAF